MSQSPNRLFFRGRDRGLRYIVKASGCVSLAELHRKKGTFAVPDVLAFVEAIAIELERLHEDGKVYSWLEPERVLMLSDGSIVLDQSTIELPKDIDSLLNAPLPSIDYTSPEQWTSGVCDARSDIYALGVIAYELLADKLPFTADFIVQRMKMRIDTLPNCPTGSRKECPQEFGSIVLRCLARDPAARFQSARELLEALGEIRFLKRLQ